MTAAEEILELARWAPSGDNTQPWRFSIVSSDHIVVNAFDTRDRCVYDLDGRASQVAVGALLETMRIAATASGRRIAISRRPGTPDRRPSFDVHLGPPDAVETDLLIGAIRHRCVQRRSLQTTALGAPRKSRLEQSVGPSSRIVWFEGARQKARMAWLATRSAKIRLTIPEAYAVHRDIIEWGARHSVDRVPDQALGAGPVSLAVMRWAMHSWARIDRMNRFAGGTVGPRIELDLIPALRCGAHFAIVADRVPETLDDFLAAGAAMQRFWLTATTLGLQLQPQYTPLVFARYARMGVCFTQVPAARRRASEVAIRMETLLPGQASHVVFMGRLGEGPVAAARSTRRDLSELCRESEAHQQAVRNGRS